MELGPSSKQLRRSESNWGSEFPHFCGKKTKNCIPKKLSPKGKQTSEAAAPSAVYEVETKKNQCAC